MKKLESNWLNDVEVRKDRGGLGRVITGPATGEIVEKLAATVMTCKNSHETTLGAAPDSGCCATCKTKLAVKDVGDDEDESDHMDETEQAERGVSTKSLDAIAKAVEERMTRTAHGLLDGKRIYSQKRGSQVRIDSPRRNF